MRERLLAAFGVDGERRNMLWVTGLFALFIWAVLSLVVLFLTPMQVVGATLAVLVGLGMLFRPRTAVVALLGIRVIVDLLWWVDVTSIGLNIMEIYGASATMGAAAICLLHFRRLQEHPALSWFVPLLLLLGLATMRTGGMASRSFLAKLVSPFLIMFLVSVFVTNWRSARTLLLTITMAGAVPVAYSLYCIYTGQNFVIAAGTERLLGGYMNATNHALVMAFLGSLAVFWAIRLGRTRWGLAAALYLGCVLVCLAYSNYRSAQIAFGVFLLLFLYLQRRYRLMAFAMVAGVLFYVQNEIMQDRFYLLYEEAFSERALEDPTLRLGSGRWALWTTSMAFFLGHPAYDLLLGMGMGKHMAHRFGIDPHNDYLTLLYQAGPVAVVAYLAILAQAVRSGLAAARRASDDWLCDTARYAVAFAVAGALTNFLTNGYLSRASPAWYHAAVVGLAFATQAMAADRARSSTGGATSDVPRLFST